jgi:hypothetical protein
MREHGRKSMERSIQEREGEEREREREREREEKENIMTRLVDKWAFSFFLFDFI